MILIQAPAKLPEQAAKTEVKINKRSFSINISMLPEKVKLTPSNATMGDVNHSPQRHDNTGHSSPSAIPDKRNINPRDKRSGSISGTKTMISPINRAKKYP